MGYSLLSVVLPLHKQENQVSRIVTSTKSALDKAGLAYEIVLVPNGPERATSDAAHREAEHAEDVRVVDGPPGWGAAVRAGVAAARGDLICFTNSARTSPEDLLLILLYAKAYPDVVVKATRRTRDNWRRRLGSLLYNLECRTLFDLPYFDVNGTPKVFPRSFSSLVTLRHADDLLDVEFALVCRRKGYPLVEVPIVSTQRVGGTSTTSYRSGWKMYSGALKLWAQVRRTPKWPDELRAT